MCALRLDYDWVLDAVRNVTSSATPIITLETNDPIRQDQLITGLKAHKYHDVYSYTPWFGLRKLNEQGGFEPVRISVESNYAPADTAVVREIGNTLRYMQDILRKQHAAFIISGVDRERELRGENTELMNALRAWALDKEIIAIKSIIVIITSNHEAAVDPYTSQYTALVRTELASEQDRSEIVRHTIGVLERATNEQIHSLTIATAGLNLHHTRAVLMKSYDKAGNIDLESVKHFKSEYIRQSDVVEIEEPGICFDDVGGYEQLKAQIRRDFIEVLHSPEKIARAALSLPRGLLFFGPPGTGKTLFAKALARETNLPFINLRSENLFSMYLGESGKRLRDAIRVAEQASPSIVFIDEIDRFGTASAGGRDGASQESNRVLKQMLEWLGDTTRKSVIVGTTNVPEQLDKAFIRPGRFSYVIPFPFPNENARLQILRSHLGLQGTRRRPDMNEKDVSTVLPKIAEDTKLYSGADLEELVTRAKREFFTSDDAELRAHHLIAALQDFRIDVESRRRMLEAYRKLGTEFADSSRMLVEMADD